MAYFASIDIVTVAVKYRLVPEHPAPTALDDAYAGLVWTVENAANFDIDPMKIMILGSSDGAPIAAGCAILAQRNQNPSSAHKCS
ncbi:Alpha/beta hydrolase fold-3 [Penicillium fimorum]|uniref:Alpha/beta hydrolase fold-3 n=1 Tax=Penicillium fimorum TaxID=1882269 RepID=A0A9W9XZT5_9EURO|nr:Alpha/beta hydrolase fold-3 [Penicillium fimorum]